MIKKLLKLLKVLSFLWSGTFRRTGRHRLGPRSYLGRRTLRKHSWGCTLLALLTLYCCTFTVIRGSLLWVVFASAKSYHCGWWYDVYSSLWCNGLWVILSWCWLLVQMLSISVRCYGGVHNIELLAPVVRSVSRVVAVRMLSELNCVDYTPRSQWKTYEWEKKTESAVRNVQQHKHTTRQR
jgi:hypothetical protein